MIRDWSRAKSVVGLDVTFYSRWTLLSDEYLCPIASWW